jgi:hypothetical protein
MIYFLYCTNDIDSSNRYHKRVNDRNYKCFFSSARSVKATCKAKLTPNIQNGGPGAQASAWKLVRNRLKTSRTFPWISINQKREEESHPIRRARTNQQPVAPIHACMRFVWQGPVRTADGSSRPTAANPAKDSMHARPPARACASFEFQPLPRAQAYARSGGSLGLLALKY